jgi:hypothetical protein
MINLMVFMIVVTSCRFSSTDVKMICPFWETLLLFAEKSMSERHNWTLQKASRPGQAGGGNDKPSGY